MAVDPEVRALSRRIADLERQILQSKRPSLAHSTIDGGALTAVNEDGDLTLAIGQQFDGTNAVAPLTGPTPPTPKPPTVEAMIGGLKIKVDGEFADGSVTPMDFSRWEIHVSTDPDFIPDLYTTLVGTLESPRGGEHMVGLPYSPHYVRIVCRANTGKGSAPSAMVGPTQPRYVVSQDLDPGIDLGGGGGGTDGEVPDSSPAASVAPLGVGALMATWPATTNADPVTYEVYVSDQPITSADPGALLTKTGALQAAISRMPDGAPISADLPTYVRVLATDPDGPAASLGQEGSGVPRRASNADISSDFVYAGEVEAEQMRSGNLQALLAILGGLTVGDPTQRRININPETGFEVLDQAGQQIVHFPTSTEGVNKFIGDLIAEGFTTNGRAQFRGRENEISRDSELSLASGVTSPANVPSPSHYMPSIKKSDGTAVEAKSDGNSSYAFNVTTYPDYNLVEPTWDANRSRLVWVEAQGEAYSRLPYLCAWDPATGAYSETAITGTQNPRIPAAQVPSHTYDPDALNNISTPLHERAPAKSTAIVGDWMYVMTARVLPDKAEVDSGAYFPVGHGYYFVYRVNLNTHVWDGSWCWRVTDLAYNNWSNAGGAFSQGFSKNNFPGLFASADGNLWLVQVNPTTGQPVFKKKNPTTGATTQTITANIAAPNPTDRVTGFYEGNIPEGYRMVVALGDSSTVHHLNPANGQSYGTAEQWQRHTGQYQASALASDGSRFWSYAGANGDKIWAHSTSLDTTPTHWAYTWYDPDPGGTGTHETSISPIATFTPRKRWGIQVVVNNYPPIVESDPDSPSEWRMYASVGPVPGVASDMHLQDRVLVDDVYVDYWAVLQSGVGRPDQTTPVAPSVNSFPDGYSAELTSSTGGFVVRGDGTGGWPYLSGILQAYADQVAATAKAEAIAESYEPGDIITSGATTRTGCLLCNGTFVNQSAYPDLFSAIGHKFNGNVDPGNGTFKLPDFQNRFPMGASATRALGSRAGSATMSMTRDQMPRHGHYMSFNTQADSHTHGLGTLSINTTGSTHEHIVNRRQSTGTNVGSAQGGGPNATDASTSGGGNHTHGFSGSLASDTHSHEVSGTTTETGVNDPAVVDVLNPYQAVNFFIKT